MISTRTGRFASGFLTGQAAILVNILYTVISVRLALAYLGKDQYGLWTLAMQISGYLILIDFGMFPAVSRFAADHKHEVNGGEYGSLLLTGFLVFFLQGCLIAMAGCGFAFLAPSLFGVPEFLQIDFRNVLMIITVSAGLSVALRGASSPLWAFQRVDVSYGLSMMTLVSGLGMLWAGLRCGLGIYSYALSGVPSLILTPILTYIICKRNHYYPIRGSWGRPRGDIFRRAFGFGRDSILMTLGSQMVNASQIMILGRFAGLESAASFSVGTKLYSMGQQFVGKVIESSAPALTELHLSGDSDRFRQRFWNTLALSALLASFVASVIIVGNKSLVSLWTSGSVGWGFSSDVLLGILLVLTACTRVLLALFGICGNLRPVRFISVSEGCVFVVLGIPAAILYGITGLLAVSLLAHVLVTGLLSLHKARQLLHPTKGSLRYVWVSLLAITVSIFSGFLCTTACKSPFHALLVLLPATAGAVLLLCWKLMLPMQLRKELIARLKGFLPSTIP